MRHWKNWLLGLGAFLALSVASSAEGRACSEASLLLMESPFGASSKYTLSIRLQPSTEGYLCRIVGGVFGAEKEEVTVLAISEQDGNSILEAFESADWDWLEVAGAPRQRKMLNDPSTHFDPLSLQGYIVVASLEREDGILSQTRPLASEKSGSTLLASLLANDSIKSAAKQVVLSASESSNAEAVVPEIWNPVLGLNLKN